MAQNYLVGIITLEIKIIVHYTQSYCYMFNVLNF